MSGQNARENRRTRHAEANSSLGCAVALLAGVMITSAIAQLPDKRTVFTFSGPVAMPGVTLPAGQYLFRLADPNTSGKVVQVLSADGSKPYGMFFSLPAERFEAAPTPEVRFMETAKGMPPRSRRGGIQVSGPATNSSIPKTRHASWLRD